MEIAERELGTWEIQRQPIFPLLWGLDGWNSRGVPRHISRASWMLRCDSRMIRVEPGTHETRTAYGYVWVQKDGRKMAMYHFWGEG